MEYYIAAVYMSIANTVYHGDNWDAVTDNERMIDTFILLVVGLGVITW